MVKLIVVIIGFVFAFLGYKKAWYPSWAFLFNILVSLYIGIMTAPQIVDKIPVIRQYIGDYSYSAGILVLTAIVFAIVQFLSVRFLITGYRASFPKIVNIAGAAFLGFMAGLTIGGFLFFLIYITPLPKYQVVGKFLAADDPNSPQGSSFVRSRCNFIHGVSLHAQTIGVEKQINKILTGWKGTGTQPGKKPAETIK
ncbi:MAG: hypothetical protein JW806_02845 [Sedimentisphaerales bacterium]|nr:hypothetical protein [Sedimentisphaerales bacterium]